MPSILWKVLLNIISLFPCEVYLSSYNEFYFCKTFIYLGLEFDMAIHFVQTSI